MSDRSGLVLPFLTDDPVFCQGVEVGMLFEQMKRFNEIEGYYLIPNQEQITLMANRLGWEIVEMEPWEDAPDEWFFLKMKRKGR